MRREVWEGKGRRGGVKKRGGGLKKCMGLEWESVLECGGR